MKKKIIIITGFVCLIFLAGGIYIITSIETATSDLDHLIMLHQVEILREHLLIQVKNTQANFYLMGTRFAKRPEVVAGNLKKLQQVGKACLDCHHTWYVTDRLEQLNVDIERYSNTMLNFVNYKGNHAQLIRASNTVYGKAEKLAAEVKDMVHIANTRLSERTEDTLIDIFETKKILYVLLLITPFVAGAICLFFVSELTKPVKLLLKATRKIKEGDLNYKIEGLKNEFGEVATSFNEMSHSLNQTMHRIQESENRYRTLFESAGDAIFILVAEGENMGDIVEANRAALKMHGYSSDEMLTLNIVKDLDTADTADKAPDLVQRILNGEIIKAELNHKKKDGTIFPVEINAGVFEYMDHKYILGIDRDISERKRMENVILQSKLEWEDTFNTITDMITIHDKDFNIIRANKAAEKILNLPVLGVTQTKCYKYYHGKDAPPEGCPSCDCFQTKLPASFEMHEPHLGMFLEIRALPRFDNDNQMIGLVHVIRDITERKGVEAAMQRTEQLKMVGEMAAGLAHEIKNPLAGIKGSVEYLVQETDISEEDQDIIMKSVDEIKRIELLLKSLLNFAKPPQIRPMLIDINELFEKTISFSLKHPALSETSSTPINVVTDLDQNIPKTMADPMQLQQVFLNLMFNAIEAMPDGGTLTVKSLHETKANTINLSIEDTGKGMDQAMQNRIFQPFYTTKHKGTGLGLAITRRLIEQHEGHIGVKSAPNKGTVFNIFLPVVSVEKEWIA